MPPERVLATHPTLESSLPTCFTHPETGQLMAPGSKVWPYFIDHKKFGRCWIGPKASFPGNQKNPDSASKADNMEGINPVKQAVKAPNSKKSTSVPIRPTSARPITTRDATPVIDKQTAYPRSRVSRKGNTDTQYSDLLVRKTNLRQSGKTEESDLIQAAINVGVISGWNKVDVLNVVEKLEREIANGKEGSFSARMMEVAGEIERLGFKGGLKELRAVREVFKGEFYDGVSSVEVGDERKWRAPGLLMLIQAGMSVAFLKVLDSAEEDDEEFDVDVFDAKAVLFFRTPTKACGEERSYLLQMSRLGTRAGQNKKFAACPGIERSLKYEEKKSLLEKVQGQVDGGRKTIRLATTLFKRLNKVAENVDEKHEGSVTQAAMESLADDGLLVLEHVYRKKVGFPVFLGDEMVDEEEEEEEEEDGKEELVDDAEDGAVVEKMVVRSKPARRQPESGNDAKETDTERTSLVVILRYRRRST